MREFDELIGIFKKLRAQDGCPWDKEQTHHSILQCAVDEVYEFLEAVENGNDHQVCEELGDLLLQVVFHSQMASERSAFSVKDVISQLNEKLYRRHPHVFKGEKASSSPAVLRNWERIKADEKPERNSAIDGIPKALPALFKAEKMQRKAASVGFDWDRLEPVIEKIREELNEFEEAAKTGETAPIENELGDVLFSIVNLARKIGISSEESLRKTIDKFDKRFRIVEKKVGQSGKNWRDMTLQEMDVYWEEAKGEE